MRVQERGEAWPTSEPADNQITEDAAFSQSLDWERTQHGNGMDVIEPAFPLSLQRFPRGRRGREYPGCDLVRLTEPTGCVWRLHQPITSRASISALPGAVSWEISSFLAAHGPQHSLSFSLDSSYS